MTTIPLIRVDNRLIHGQVTAYWATSLSCNRIIIVDDETYENKYVKNILILAMPQSTKLDIYTFEEAAKRWRENQLGEGRAMVIFKDIAGAQKAFNAGFEFNKLQIGGSFHESGKKRVLGPIYLNENEAKILNELGKNGVDIIFQVLSEQKATSWTDVRKKSFPNI